MSSLQDFGMDEAGMLMFRKAAGVSLKSKNASMAERSLKAAMALYHSESVPAELELIRVRCDYLDLRQPESAAESRVKGYWSIAQQLTKLKPSLDRANLPLMYFAAVFLWSRFLRDVVVIQSLHVGQVSMKLSSKSSRI